ncbi:MAG: putative PurR-regulated permease PerM [Saprospiraceae bacterium]|jgi:predicted PurR-regulated permease PerM
MKKKLPQYFVLLLLALITALFFWLIRDYLMAVFWAIVLSLIFQGLFIKINTVLKGRRSLASILTVLTAVVLMIGPLTILGSMMLNETKGIAIFFAEGINVQEYLEMVQSRLPYENATYEKCGISPTQVSSKVDLYIANGADSFLTYFLDIISNMAVLILNFVLMIFMFYFFMKDGNKLIKKTLWVMPVRDYQMQEIITKFEKVTKATIKGSLVVALIQGVLGGFIFWLVGIQGALLWGAVMILASLLPAGTALVWAPWSIVLFMNGKPSEEIVLIVFGIAVIAVIGNILRPLLVGKDTKLPDYLILLSILGGLAGFGVSGFIIGPIIAALFVTLWEIMGKEFGTPYNEIVANDDRRIGDTF